LFVTRAPTSAAVLDVSDTAAELGLVVADAAAGEAECALVEDATSVLQGARIKPSDKRPCGNPHLCLALVVSEARRRRRRLRSPPDGCAPAEV